MPTAVSEAVMRALAKSPEERPESVAAFVALLRPEGTTSRTATPEGQRQRSRRLVWAGIVAAGIAILAAAAFLALRATPPPTTAVRHPSPTPRPTASAPVLTLPPIPWPATDGHDKKKDDNQGKSHGKGKKKGH